MWRRDKDPFKLDKEIHVGGVGRQFSHLGEISEIERQRGKRVDSSGELVRLWF